MKYFLLFTVVIFPLVSNAKESVCEREAQAKSTFARPRGGVLSPEDREDIAALFASYKGYLSDEAQVALWKQVMDIYLEARLRTVPENSRARAYRLMKNLQPHFNNDNRVVRKFSEIDLPSGLHTTVIPFIVQVHEWEHLLQLFEHIDLSNGKMFVRVASNELNLVHKYRMEREAMSAEWEIRSVIPAEMIESSWRAVSYLKPSQFTLEMTRILRYPASSEEEYVKHEHEAQRNSALALAKSSPWMPIVGAPALMLVVRWCWGWF